MIPLLWRRQVADVIFALERDLRCAAGTHTPVRAVPGKPVFGVPPGAWWCRWCRAILGEAGHAREGT